MFDFVAKYRKWIMFGLLVLIVPPFAVFGIDQYVRDQARANTVAVVGDYEISEQEFGRALQQRQEALREMSGGRVDPAILDSPEQRAAVLENLVRQRVLLAHALKAGLTITPEQLRAYISQAPDLQENGQFSYDRYQQFLKARGTTEAAFENDLRRQLLMVQMSEAYVAGNFTSRTVAERLARLSQQQREVSRAVVSPEKFVAQVKLEEGAAKKYYDENQAEFRTPEQVRVEYVTLSAEAMLALAPVDPADVKKYYESNQRQWGTPEMRHASHILIAVDKSAGDDAKKKARAQAEQILQELKKNPSAFPELAKKYSQDPGSAAKGGDLGEFPHGAMVKPFDDAVFSLKPGEISPIVESEYGFHIIRLTGVTPAQAKTLEQARPEIERELRKIGAARAHAETAEKLNNVAFEQSDSLKGAAELLKQTPQKSGWITRTGSEDARFANPRLIQAVFSEDVLVNKRNTEAIEIAPGTIVVARVAEHKPSTMQPLDSVRAAIEKKLIEQRAAQLAAQEGRQILEQLRQGKEPQVAWGAPQLVSRADSKGLHEAAVRQVFRADTARLPAYAGAESGSGYVLLRVSRVVEAPSVDRAQQKALGDGLAQLVGEEHFAAYVQSLKDKTKIKINKEALERKGG